PGAVRRSCPALLCVRYRPRRNPFIGYRPTPETCQRTVNAVLVRWSIIILPDRHTRPSRGTRDDCPPHVSLPPLSASLRRDSSEAARSGVGPPLRQVVRRHHTARRLDLSGAGCAAGLSPASTQGGMT